jgi:hypothetical protein
MSSDSLSLGLSKSEDASRPRSGPSENSSAIYRWGSVGKSKQSAKRTAENQAGIRANAIFISSAPEMPILHLLVKALESLQLLAETGREQVQCVGKFY